MKVDRPNILITSLLLWCFAAHCNGLSVRSAIHDVISLFEGDTEPDDKSVTCHVNKFAAVESFDAVKFAGDWFEIGRTRTMLPDFKSGVYKFSAGTNGEPHVFFFSARMVNGECLKPIPGEIVSSSTNPGTLIFTYDGLKARVEEELKLIQTDYTDVAVLYGCRKILDNGECHKNGSFVSVLSRNKSPHKSILEIAGNSIKSVCVNPKTVIRQHNSDSCDLNNPGSKGWKETIEDGNWPVCKNLAICTLSCPPCCVEDENGCISCSCGDKDDKICKASSDCPADCTWEQGSADCGSCTCPETPFYQLQNVVQPPQAAPAFETKIDESATLISNPIECPTTCRTKKKDDKLYCDCSNRDICDKRPTEDDCKGDESRYYYDKRTSTCHAFFGNCQENPNSFTSSKECMAVCADVCDLPPDMGPCRGNQARYYFNAVQGECATFIYGGCQGNENNFVSKQECNLRCPAAFQETGAEMAPSISAACLENEEKGTCDSNELRYLYDVVSKNCRSFFYTGCGGNNNNFESEQACKAECTATDCEELQSCDLRKCQKVQTAKGCEICECPDSATGLTVSVSTIITFVIVSLLIK